MLEQQSIELNRPRIHVLLAGWFSFAQVNCTAGDLLARDLVSAWLNSAGIAFDIATAPPFETGVDFFTVEPSHYTHVVFLCGPYGRTEIDADLLGRFSECRLIGLNLSYLEHPDTQNVFDVLIERDSITRARPDLVFAAPKSRVPVVGLILVHPQHEYGGRAKHDTAHSAIYRLLGNLDVAVVHIDTLTEQNATGLRSPAEVESVIAKMDLVITTRLHGAVLSLRNGVPFIAVDPIAGGAKILKQCAAVGWPNVLTVDALTEERLREAYGYCLTSAARERAADCAAAARKSVAQIHMQFLTALTENIPYRKASQAKPANEVERWQAHPAHIAQTLPALLHRTIPHHANVIIVDDGAFISRLDTQHTILPFTERDGNYWGPPISDDEAIDELERMRSLGADFIVFVPTSQWWLNHYKGLSHYLSSHFPKNADGFYTIFDLREFND